MAPHWTQAESDRIRELVLEHKPATEIAEIFDRPVRSVERRIAKLFPGGTGRKPGGVRPVEVRLKQIDVRGPAECHEWKGKRNEHGYGRIRIDGSDQYVHRVVWSRANGPIPDGMVVRHRCDNPPCANLAHLELGTKGDNHQDAVTRGRLGRDATNGRMAGRA